jgi:hypothetical protein
MKKKFDCNKNLGKILKDKELIKRSIEFQQFLFERGISWHNPISNECCLDFSCCMPINANTKYMFPSPDISNDFVNEFLKNCKPVFDISKFPIHNANYQNKNLEKIRSFFEEQ